MMYPRFWSRWRAQFIFMIWGHQLGGKRYVERATIVCPFSLPAANTGFEIGIGRTIRCLDTFTGLMEMNRKNPLRRFCKRIIRFLQIPIDPDNKSLIVSIQPLNSLNEKLYRTLYNTLNNFRFERY